VVIVTSEPASGIAAAIRAFVVSRFPLARSLALGDDGSLLDSGLIDSLGILDIVAFLEENFGIQVGESDLRPDNFDSVGAIARFVLGKR
jgi:acyl carrier protein